MILTAFGLSAWREGVVTGQDGEGYGRSWSEHINFQQPMRHSRHFMLIRVAYFLSN